MKPLSLAFALLLLVLNTPCWSQTSVVDSVASYQGPFDGATGFPEMAQTFEISITGYLRSLEAYVPCMDEACEFTWFLRDGSLFDPLYPDVGAQPVLATGTALTDVSSWIYDAEPSTLASDLAVPVAEGDFLILHIVRCGNLWWVSGEEADIGKFEVRRWERTE